MSRKRPSLAKGLIAGAAAGIAATLMMDQFQSLLSSAQKATEKHKRMSEGEPEWQIKHDQAQAEQENAAKENSTERAARRIAQAAGTSIANENRKAAGQAVHYGFGTLMGLVYAVTAEWLPDVTAGSGAAFGTLLFLTADEVAVPAFQLSASPTETPISGHLQYWAAHMVYGATLETTRNLVRRWL
jgi:hypothetical protein